MSKCINQDCQKSSAFSQPHSGIRINFASAVEPFSTQIQILNSWGNRQKMWELFVIFLLHFKIHFNCDLDHLTFISHTPDQQKKSCKARKSDPATLQITDTERRASIGCSCHLQMIYSTLERFNGEITLTNTLHI